MIRKRKPAAREQLRCPVIRMYRRGHKHTAIVEAPGLRRPTVTAWIARANERRGVNEGRGGRRPGDGRKLTPVQEERVRKDIVDHTPHRLQRCVALWRAQAGGALIKAYCGIDRPVRSLRNYLKRRGCTPQRRLKRAFEQKPHAVQKVADRGVSGHCGAGQGARGPNLLG